MERFGQIIKVKTDKIEEYKKYHAATIHYKKGR